MGLAAACPEQAEIVVELSLRRHVRTRAATAVMLVDGDCRSQSLYAVHFRRVHAPQELPRIGGQTLHEAPLPLGK